MPEILSTMQQEYEDRSKNDKKLGQIRKQIKAGATYSEAEAYAARSGEILSGVLKNNIDADVFADEDLNGLVVPMMRTNYEKVVSATSSVQATLNKAANIGIKPIVPEFNEGAAFNLVDKMRSYDSFEEAEWLLGEPVVTNSMKCVDEMLRENADFQYRSGMSPKIVRTAEANCCDWCQELAGVYEYSELTNTDEVWQRHANCKCEVTFVPGNGKVQDVHSKAFFDGEKAAERIALSNQPISVGRVPERFSKYVPESKKDRRVIISEGLAADTPVFVIPTETLSVYSKYIEKKEGFYDVVLHGLKSGYGFEFNKTNKIDPDTLCAIIAQRSDYQKGTPIRLISCYSGSKKDGTAQYIANKLGVDVLAPDTKAYVYKPENGISKVIAETQPGKGDGNWITFTPKEKGESK